MSRDPRLTPNFLQPFTVPIKAGFLQPFVWHNSPPLQAPLAASTNVMFRQALALHQGGNLVEARRLYKEVLAQVPTHFDALHLLGVLALQTQNTISGVDLIAKALRLNPNSWGAYNNLGNGLRDLKRPEEALASLDRAIALKPDYAEAHNSRGIVLQDLRRLEDALVSFENAIALSPSYADAFNNRGIVLHELTRSDEALISFETAIAYRPDHAAAYYNRGMALQDLLRPHDALASFEKAIALKPDYAEAYNNRGLVLQDLTRLEDALASFDKAVAQSPTYAEAHNNRAIVLQELRRSVHAIASFEQAVALKPDYAEAHHNKGLLFLQMGRFEEGWPLYEWRKKLKQPFGSRSFSQPLWLGKGDISHRTLFVHWEQGLGDTIQFYRFCTLLSMRGAKVVASIQEPLYRLFRQVTSLVEVIRHDEVPGEFDCHCPLMSLPFALGTRLETIPSEPYIWADERLCGSWKNRLPPKTKTRIGIVWRGGKQHRNDHNRSIDLSLLAPILSPDAHWISLQKEITRGDSGFLELHQIGSYNEGLTDFADTAALFELLDLIITVDTSVAHLAGAMGKPVWILLPYNSDWRWLCDRNDTPWYPSARLFRQNGTRSWENVISDLRAAVVEFIQRAS